jgi:hypothetical protein
VATLPPGFLSGDGAFPAAISLPNRPAVGRALTLNVGNVDPSVGANITVISAGSLPGIDLGILGMPGCGAWVTLPEVTSLFALGAPPYSWTVVNPIPAAFAGIDLYAQAVQFSAHVPPYNPANLLLSDAVCFHIDLN